MLNPDYEDPQYELDSEMELVKIARGDYEEVDEEDWGRAEPSTDDILVGTEDDFDLD